MSRRRDLLAIVGALVVLFLAASLDSWMHRAQEHAAATFDAWDVYPHLAVGTVAVCGACLLVGWLGWKAAPLVGVLYVLVGGFLAGLPLWIFGFGVSADGRPPLIPEPVVRRMTDLLLRSDGPLRAVATISGATLVTGLVCLVRWLRARRVVAPPAVVESTAGA